jgi:hypothetical protein
MYKKVARLPFLHFLSRCHLARLPPLRLQFFHLLRILLLNPLDRLVTVIFHHSLFLEVFDLDSQSVQGEL